MQRFGRPVRRLRTNPANTWFGEGQSDGIAATTGDLLVLAQSPNQPPVAKIGVPQPNFTATVDQPVTLDPRGSFDPDPSVGWGGTWTITGTGGAVRFTFSGTFANYASHVTSWTPTIAESVTVRLDVHDEQGATDSTSITGTVRAAPAPTTLSVAPSSFALNTGGTVVLTGAVLDQYGQGMSGQTITWASGNTARAAVSPSSGSQTTATAGSQTGAVTITATSGTLSATSAGTITVPSSSHPNEPASMTQVATRQFNAVSEPGWFQAGISVVSDPGAPSASVGRVFFPAHAGQTTLAGASPGRTSFTAGAGQHYRTIYIDTWLKVSSNYYNNAVNTKIWIPWIASQPRGVMGLIGSGLSDMVFQARLQALYGYVGGTSGGAVNLSANRGQVVFTRGVWHRFHLIFAANTPGVNDGTIQWWVDGTLCGDWGGIGWSGPTESNYWEIFEWNPIYGGGATDNPEDMYMYCAPIYWSGK